MGEENPRGFQRAVLAGAAAVGIAAVLGSQKDAGAVNQIDFSSFEAPPVSTAGPIQTREPTLTFTVKTEESERTVVPSVATPTSSETGPVLENIEKVRNEPTESLSGTGGKAGRVSNEVGQAVQIVVRESLDIEVFLDCQEVAWDFGDGEVKLYLAFVKGDKPDEPIYKVTYKDEMGVIADIQKIGYFPGGSPFFLEAEKQAMLMTVTLPDGTSETTIISSKNFSKFMPPEGMKFKDNIVAEADYEKVLVNYREATPVGLTGEEGVEEEIERKVVAVYDPISAQFIVGGPADILEKTETK